MSGPPVPTIEPRAFYAGDTVTWEKTLADYPASEWTLTYYIRGASHDTDMDVVGVADGDTHVVTIAAAETDTWDAGDYWWTAKAVKGAEEYSVGHGTFEILRKLSGIAAVYDGRSFAKKMLDAIEAVIENRGTSSDVDVVSKGIGDKNITRNPEALFKWRDKFRDEYLSEQAEESARRGEGTGTRILARPRRPA